MLENICGPALLYLGFSIIQIVIDLYKGLYNTTFIKFVVAIIFTLFLNILCASGLTMISWFIVFIPFITMTIITTLLLYVFGLDPSMGIRRDGTNVNASIMGYDFNYNNTGTWEVIFADGSMEIITVTNGYYTLYGEEFRLSNTNPITIQWPDGTIQTLQNVSNSGQIYWTTDHSLPKYQTIIWRASSSPMPMPSQSNINNDTDMFGGELSPCPPNMTPSDYNKYYGGNCATKNTLDDFHYRSSGSFRVTYYDGYEEIINMNNGSYVINGTTYTLTDTTPITIVWPDGTIQTIDIIEDTYIRWTTNHTAQKYKYIIWESISTNNLLY